MTIFSDVNAWQAVTSGQVRLDLRSDADALCLQYDFAGQGGFAVARRRVDWQLPRRFRLRLRLHGEGLPNRFEIKLIDSEDNALANVWWHQRAAQPWPQGGTEWVLESPDFSFAWGPAGGGLPDKVVVLEFAIVAGEGGAGRVWLQDWQMEDLAEVQRCTVRAFNRVSGERMLDSPAGWIAESSADWLQLEWPEAVDVAAVMIEWVPGSAPQHFVLGTTAENDAWETLLEARDADAQRHFLYLGARKVRRLRLQQLQGSGPVQVRALERVPPERARSLTDYLHEVSAQLPRGRLPRYFSREQSYWTVIGAPACPFQALINEDGMIEIQRPGFSIEAQVLHGNVLHTWAEGASSVALAAQCWPVPRVMHESTLFALETTAAAVKVGGRWCVLVHYRLRNSGTQTWTGQLLARVRPFQVTPPWQAYHDFGGVFPIRALQWQAPLLQVNDRYGVMPLTPPQQCLLQPWLGFDDDRLADRIVQPSVAQIRDESGLAQAILAWTMTLAPSESREVSLLVPFEAMSREEQQRWRAQCPVLDSPTQNPSAFLQDAVQQWDAVLGSVTLAGGEAVQQLTRVLRTATAHILVNRSGSALQPGPRRYARSWIRDGATMGAALLRMGRADAVAAFAEWYALFLRNDGYVPCCVDESGADPLVEHDSHGQWLYLMAEVDRFRNDANFRARMLPDMQRVVEFLCQLRAQRCTAEYQLGERKDRFGLLPESVSHEGYLAQPVHAYWDDVWAWRGLLGAADFFVKAGDIQTADRCRQEADALARSIVESMTLVMSARDVDFLPGSVEWADFDPAATACAVAQLDAAAWLPQDALHKTYHRFLRGWRERLRDGRATHKYSAYDVRVVAALLRLGWRDAAHELLGFLLQDMRPHAWQQWPEISWPDFRSPGHLGDLPHSWIGAEAVLAILALFVAEQGNALVLGQGVKLQWLDEGVQGTGWHTPHGVLDFVLRQEAGGGLRIRLAGDVAPPDGIVLALPGVTAQSVCVVVQGDLLAPVDGLLRLRAAPVELLIT